MNISIAPVLSLRSIIQQALITTEKILIKSGLFNLPVKKNLNRIQNEEIKTIVVDVSEHEIDRTRKKKKNKYYSAQQKYHTIKSQVLANKKSGKIICTAFSEGKTHDFSFLKKSKFRMNEELELLADKGYQGIKKNHNNSRTHKKKQEKRTESSRKTFKSATGFHRESLLKIYIQV